MTMKKTSEISKLVSEAQDPIDETRDLDETYNLNTRPFTLFEQAKEFGTNVITTLKFTSAGVACLSSGYLLGILLSPNVNYPVQKEKAAICDTVIAPLQESMRNSCNQDNFERGTALKEISDKKNQVLEQYGCTPQEWQCKPSKPYDLDNSTYTVEFRYK